MNTLTSVSESVPSFFCFPCRVLYCINTVHCIIINPNPNSVMCARAARSRLHSVRKNWTYDPPITRRTVVDEYGAGPPEKAGGSDRGVLRRGGKRDFSPYLNRGLGESHSTQYAVRKSTQYAVREKSLWTLFG